jgi:hypothetical protein
MNLRKQVRRAVTVLLTPVAFLLLLISVTCIAINYGLAALVRMIDQ